jgi:RNA polymerase-binding transcription factor DksA
MDLEHARERIHEEQQRVQGLAAEVRGELGATDGDESSELADYDQHPADSGSETFEREKDFSILEELEAELAELEAALHRIDAGTYGVDEVTGDPIDPERLEVVPAARTNVGTEPPDRRADPAPDRHADTDADRRSATEPF